MKIFYPDKKHRYDLTKLVARVPELSSYMQKSPSGEDTIDFHEPRAVFLLNKALLEEHFGIIDYVLPSSFLSPAVPGRAHYVHKMQEFIGKDGLRVLDIGCGANLIYPILGVKMYAWSVVGSDVDNEALTVAQAIIDKNGLSGQIELRKQSNKSSIFTGVIKTSEKFDLCICNPPFYKSVGDLQAKSGRKQRNLGTKKGVRNFEGREHELVYPGGEYQFVNSMIYESEKFKNQVTWFSSLVSRSENLDNLLKMLDKRSITDKKVIEMVQGNKKSRILAWTYKNS